MGLNTGDKILAQDFINLKSRVEAECTRRSVSSTINNVTQSKLIEASDLNTLISPLRSINTNLVPSMEVSRGDLIQSISGLENILTYFESCNKVGINSGCASNCMGLCQGCSGTCQSSCTGSCVGGCSGSCSGTCSGCTGTCIGTCYYSCWSDGCSTTCGGCTDMCMTTCYAACVNVNA